MSIGIVSSHAVIAGAGPSSYAAAVLADSPLAYWRLEETSNASPMADSTGNGRSGTYDSAATHPAGLLSAGGTGLSGEASAPAAAWQTSLTGLTMEFLFKTSSSATMALFGRTNAGGFGTAGTNFWRAYISSGSVTFQVFDTGFNPIFTLTTSGTNYADGVTHHTACTWDGSTARIYIGGSQVASGSAVGTMAANTGTVPVCLGHMAGSYPLSGTLDEVAVYDHALSSTQVATHYAAI